MTFIDYGRNLTCNRDLETGIRYGIISAHDMPSWLYAELDYVYHDCESCGDDCQCEREPDEITFDIDGVKGFLDDSNDVWIVDSPHTILGVPCSPCAPGACTIPSDLIPVDGGIECYSIPMEWKETDK